MDYILSYYSSQLELPSSLLILSADFIPNNVVEYI
jgi:hypothetical protein